jgi:archaemetzincin
VESTVCDEFHLVPGPRLSIELPACSFDSRRDQHNSELILRTLLALKPPQADRMLGITEVDLFIPMLSFVFGQAQLSGTVAVVSAARLRQEFYGFPPEPVLSGQRLVVESVHEIGHTFGLTHCLDRTCPMSLSTSLRALDMKGSSLCVSCRLMLREQLRNIQSQS